MKQFETKLTVRIYDTKLVENLNELFRRNANRYQTKNQLLVELLERGMVEKMKDLTAAPGISASVKNYDLPIECDSEIGNLLKQLKAMISDMHDYNRLHIEGLLAHLKMSERISAAIYNVLLAVATDAPVLKAQVEVGYFDDIPKRYIEFLHDLLSALHGDGAGGSDSEDPTGCGK